ncbi:MAG: 4'-phosphopantetheinyl transferase superfamily protein [Bacteroidales bacterium]|jgi:4'-phosphopantetheinyl transferase|nr:4'-phosphopantetheinyl transferase superfamily protein [Bacteroidales bacterium]
MVTIKILTRPSLEIFESYQELFLSILSEKERYYILKSKKEKDRIEKTLGWILCRMEASERFHVHPSGVVVAAHEKGKPYYGDFPELEFNLTHGGDVIIAAFSENRAVGVDVEALTRKANLEIAKRYFTLSEATFIESLSENDQRRAFLRFWTIKEAYLKMIGVGLTRPLDSFEIQYNEECISIYDNEVLQLCDVVQNESDGKHIVTVCVENRENKFQFSEIDLQTIITFVKKFK